MPLVLNRKRGERIVIDDRIVIEVVECGGRVTLAFTAPKDVRIDREEVWLLLHPNQELPM